jgi:hypothetical protein
VRYPQCGHDNPDGANFCGACGTRMEGLCSGCGTSNPLINKFCYQCGQALAPLPAKPHWPTWGLNWPVTGEKH